MLNSRISVIIPAYNADKFIAATLNSILNQSLPPHEVIIVDDGSTDATLSVISEFRVKNPNIIVVSQENKGLPAARNSGIKVATGNLIAFCDSDDLWSPDKLKHQVEHLRKNFDCLIVATHYSTFTLDASLSLPGRRPNYALTPRNLITGISWIPGSASSVLINTEKYPDSQLYFDSQLTFAEDLEMWIKLSKLGNLCVIDFSDVFIRIHKKSMQSVSLRLPSSYLASMCKINQTHFPNQLNFITWLIERLFLWPIAKRFILGDRDIFSRLDWNVLRSSTATIREGKLNLIISVSVSIILHTVRFLILLIGPIASKFKGR